MREEYRIHYELEEYSNGNNLCFSIEFIESGKQTYWFNDNHEFGDEDRSRDCSVRIAEWFLEDRWRIDMINSGYNDFGYIEYRDLFNAFIISLYE